VSETEDQKRFASLMRRIDENPALLRLFRAARKRLPGDENYCDPLSLSNEKAAGVIGQQLAIVAAERPSALKEVGFSALQVWQSLSEAQGRGRGDEPLAIVFVDLVRFSDWALEAGDDAALDLLRTVGRTVDPVLLGRDGRIVKRLGDGLMAVFEDTGAALDATLEASESVRAIHADGYEPELRAGIHYGKPRKLGSDYFGVDVNVAARVADAAGPSQVLVSEALCEHLDDAGVNLRRQWRFKAQGAPKGMKVFAAERTG
jgi:adenylate cyclase